MTLSRKMAKGAAWLVLFRLTDRSIGLVSTLILARLLVPADFGLVAMAMSILALLEMMSAFSFDTALIQNQNAERRHYDTAWTFEVLLGLANGLALVALAVPVAAFYTDSRVTGIMIALAAYCAVKGFGNIGCVAFQKDLDLHKEFVLGVTRKLVTFAATMALAWWLRSYWALVGGTLVSSVTGLLLTYAMHPYRPRFSLAARGELFHFSKWLLINNILIGVIVRGVDFVIGKISGAAALGLYTIGYEISNLPTTELVFPISRAVYPGYAKMARDIGELRSGYLNVLAIIAILAIPAGTGISVLAEPIVYGLLGAKWAEVVPLIQILAIYGIVRACTSNMGSIYLALGKPRTIAYFAGLTIVLLFPLLIWLVRRDGPIGAAWALLAVVAIMTPVNLYALMPGLRLTLLHLADKIWRPLVASLIMAVAVATARAAWAEMGYIAQITALVPLGAFCYTVSILLLWIGSGRPSGGEGILLNAAIEQVVKLRTKLRDRNSRRSGDGA